MRLLLFGPPGVGKGTQARLLVDRFALAHISTGQLIRDAIESGDPVGLEAERWIDRGQLAPDEIVRPMAERALGAVAYDQFILDGYPRTVRQARWLDDLLTRERAPLSAVMSIKVPLEVIVDRLSQRRVHKETGETYHLTFNPPPADADPALIVQRDDDRPQAIRERLSVYRAQTREVEAYYSDRPEYHAIDGVGTIEEVHRRILEAIRTHPVASPSA